MGEYSAEGCCILVLRVGYFLELKSFTLYFTSSMEFEEVGKHSSGQVENTNLLKSVLPKIKFKREERALLS